MEKITTPQVLVSYPGGASGEWLAIQIGMHNKYSDNLKFSKYELGVDIGNNRWLLRHNWRMKIHPEFIAHFEDRLFDNSTKWWSNFNKQIPDKRKWYKQAMSIMDGTGSIPVHRSHCGWYDVFWKDLFTEYKTITIKIDPLHKPSVDRVEQNYIKKVLWNEQGDIESLIARMPTSKTYKQYHHKLNNDWFVLDFKRMFLDKDYYEYLKMCEFLDMQPWPSNKWIKKLNAYLLPDEQKKLTLQDLREKHL